MSPQHMQYINSRFKINITQFYYNQKSNLSVFISYNTDTIGIWNIELNDKQHRYYNIFIACIPQQNHYKYIIVGHLKDAIRELTLTETINKFIEYVLSLK